MRRRESRRPAIPTRDRILNAAALQFSQNSYEAVGLRSIAADAGVNVAYVHRSFGSKEQLFAAAILSQSHGDRLLARVGTNLGPELAKEFFAPDAAREKDAVKPLEIVIHSLSSPEASHVLRKIIVEAFIEPLAGKLKPTSRRRAALMTAFLLGAGILREVLHVDDMLEAEGGELERVFVDAITAMARGSARSRGEPDARSRGERRQRRGASPT